MSLAYYTFLKFCFNSSAISTTTVPWSQNDQEFGNLQLSGNMEVDGNEDKV